MQHLDDSALPVTRGQLDVWLAQETRQSAAEWQLGLFVEIGGAVEREALEWAISRAVGEAEPVRAAFFEADGQVYQRPLDYSAVELDVIDLSQASEPLQQALELASSIQRTPIPLDGRVFSFSLFECRADEAFLFVCCHHVAIDGYGLALVCQRIAAIYSALVSGAPIPPAIFGSLKDLLDCESEYEASEHYVEDRAYWTENRSMAAWMPSFRWRSSSRRPPCDH